MKKPCEVLGIGLYDLHIPSGAVMQYPELLSGRYTEGGEDAQFIANFLEDEKTFMDRTYGNDDVECLC